MLPNTRLAFRRRALLDAGPLHLHPTLGSRPRRPPEPGVRVSGGSRRVCAAADRYGRRGNGRRTRGEQGRPRFPVPPPTLSIRPPGSAREGALELPAHIGPRGAHDGVVGGGPDRTILARHVAAAHAFEHGPEPLDGATRLRVALVRPERNAVHAPDVEGVGQQEIPWPPCCT